MAQPVWVLSVDLQTKTATFQSGMADAARSARGAFNDIKAGSGDMGREVGGNMMEARHGVMLLGEEFGIHLPRALTSFIASIGPVGAAMEAAFPFLAIAVGATLLIQHLFKLKEAGEELTKEQANFGIATQNAFRTLDEKLLQAGIRADELRNDHLGALAKQLQLIDMQSMAELEKSFEEVARRSDVVFKQLESSWYSFARGSAGAKASMDEFGIAYRKLLASGDDAGAADLLNKKFQREKHILETMQKMESGRDLSNSGQTHEEGVTKFLEAQNELKRMGVDVDKESVASMQQVVDALGEQYGVQQRLNDLKKQDKANATTGAAKEGSGEVSAAARAAAESALRINEQKLQADRALANAQMAMQGASADEREAIETAFADRELQIRLAANTAQISALDKFAKDYPNQLKALHEKAEELEQQHATQVAEIQAKSQTENNAESTRALEQGIRESIEATQQGTAARLAAIDAGIKQEQARNQTAASSYRDLLTQRVETIRQMTEEENKLRAEAAHEAADNDEKLGMMALAAEKQHQAMLDSLHRVTIQQRMQEEIAAANQEYALKLTAAAHDIDALDKSGKDYENKLKALQNKQTQLIKAHENEVTAIKEKAEIERNRAVLAEANKFNDQMTAGMAQVLMGHENFAKMVTSLGNQVVSGMIQNAIKMMEANLLGKESDAAKAARTAYNIGLSAGGPLGMVLGPTFAAIAFAGVSGFEAGGIVPGYGVGDTVPAMLTPGEAVLPRGLTESLTSAARSGTMGGGTVTHVHAHFRPTIHAIDGDSVSKMLDKHGSKFQKHLENTMRKMNR